jgi:NAD(P)-dependent dehydrogenase (short-subunit alcohol dehydrogenase family)
MVKDKVVLVTGAGGGIGRAMALMYAQHGAKVVVNDVGAAVDGAGSNAGPAQAVVDEIKAAGGQALADTHSVSDPQGAQAMVEAAVNTFGQIDCVVNNAGILRDRIFHKMSFDDFDAVIKVHLYGSFLVSKAACNFFKEQGSGSYVFMTSTSGLVGNFGQANYAAAKLGIAALAKSIALDMQRFNVRANCISPFAWSRMIGSIPADTPEQQARLARLQQMTPEKIAPLAVYLASDQAKDVTGQIFAVRNNEIFLMSQSRPVRSVQRSEGWTPQSVGEHAIPAMRANFFPLDRSQDVFSWDPV